MQGYTGFIQLCRDCKSEAALTALFDFFFTEEEKSDLALRYLIVRELLRKGLSQREISSVLDVSIAKITRGSNELKKADKRLLNFLKSELL